MTKTLTVFLLLSLHDKFLNNLTDFNAFKSTVRDEWTW